MRVKTLLKWLEHPLTRGLPLDDPRMTELHGLVIRSKAFLSRLYAEWYARLANWLPRVPNSPGKLLEIGSGGAGGLIKEWVPDCLTSDITPGPQIDLVCDARHLPFADGELRGIVMVDVLHHIPDVEIFLAEAERTLQEGGRVVMLEPWNTWLSRFIYRHLHHEPFEPGHDWSFIGLGGDGPLTNANTALPWIIFERDRSKFENFFPNLALMAVELDYPFSYLLSGGVSFRSLVSGRLFGPVRGLEKMLRCLMPRLAMFAVIILEKREGRP